MNGKRKKKIAVDLLLTLALLLLMPYGMVGEAAHEWIGMGMLVLFVIHHILNRRWIRNLGMGRYTPLRILQTVLAALILACMLGSMASGILLSRYLFALLRIRGVYRLAGSMNILCAYWGLVLMSLHLGLHRGMVTGMAGRWFAKPSALRKWGARAAALAVAVYGVYAFGKRAIGSYMLLQSHFVFFDYEEPLLLFLLDYVAVMGLFVWLGYYLTRLLRKLLPG